MLLLIYSIQRGKGELQKFILNLIEKFLALLGIKSREVHKIYLKNGN